MPDELWTNFPDIVQEVGIKAIPKKENCRNAKWFSEENLQKAMKRREVKGKGKKERYTHLNAEFQRKEGRDKKAFLSDHGFSRVAAGTWGIFSSYDGDAHSKREFV